MATDKEKYYLGEGIKILLSLNPSDDHPDLDLTDAPFTVELWCKPNKVVTISNDKLRFKDTDQAYVVTLNSESVGVGNLNLRVTTKIADSDFEEGYNYVICLEQDIAEILKPQ